MSEKVTNALLARVRSSPDIVLAVDPGETTGWALLDRGVLKRCGQITPIESHQPNLAAATSLLRSVLREQRLMGDPVPIVVMEKFFLYPHKRKQQTGSTFPTVEVIGVLRLTAQQLGLRVIEQSASMAKTLVTDDRLKSLKFWVPGKKHARDAIRHALYYVLTKK